MHEPLDRACATRMIQQLVARPGAVGFTTHGLDELADDALAPLDAVRVLRRGRVRHPIRFEEGTWRYRVWADGVCVVVAFDWSAARLVVVTAWRSRTAAAYHRTRLRHTLR